MNKGIYSLIGFLLFFIGMMALVLQLVGVQIMGFTWLDNWGGGIGLALRLLMVIGGLVTIFVTRSGEQMHEEFFE